MESKSIDRSNSSRSRHGPESDSRDRLSTASVHHRTAVRPASGNGRPVDRAPQNGGARGSFLGDVEEIALSRACAGTRGARRALNVVAAAVGIVLTAPLMLVIAALIKLTSPGPVLYTQRRVGLDERHPAPGDPNGRGERRRTDLGGRPFRIYKFRTMRVGSDRRQVWASPDDPRVTALGRILRCTRLDELPQLFNVLKGEMNVVGPRPEQPEIFQRLRDQLPGYEMRQMVLPGITGWAQVNHCYDRCLDDVKQKVAFDLEYIGRASATQDLRIMLRTPAVMLGRDGGW